LTISLKRHMFPRNQGLGCFGLFFVESSDPRLGCTANLERFK
jgi:hypothetical protein